ncbi:MAG: tol-pal system-associated acyl-CoA thioesterase [Rhodoferax sp.]
MPDIGPEHRLELRIYWEDTDAGGVVFYANYLKYFERARTEWLRRLGVAQSTAQRELDCLFVVADLQLRYLAPARLDDWLFICTRVRDLGKASMVFEQQALRGEQLLVAATVRVGCVKAGSLRPRRIPPTIAALLHAAQPAA